MELHINWLCWKLTVAVKGSRQPVPVCPCARWCIGSSWWTRCLHSAPLLLRSAQKWYGGSLISLSLYFQPVPSCLLTFHGTKMGVFFYVVLMLKLIVHDDCDAAMFSFLEADVCVVLQIILLLWITSNVHILLNFALLDDCLLSSHVCSMHAQFLP